MKKVININFQGRVIPIEETAFEILKNYIESLRTYFAREDGRDEIINDIESRIAELFSERLKKGGQNCITDADVQTVMLSMGRPEDFEAENAEEAGSSSKTTSTNNSGNQTNYNRQDSQAPRGKFYRNADDKVIAGVAGGLANYFKIDPVVVRIVFAVFFAALLWVYILLWIVVPSQSLQNNVTRRLYRSLEDKMIGGVCGGLSAYFNIDAWIPRLIFALPIVFSLFSRTSHWDPFFTLRILSGSLTSTMVISYIVLWIAVPLARTSAEKLEMKGEKVDLNSIRDTVKEDMGAFKNKAKQWSEEVKEAGQQFTENMKNTGSNVGSQARNFTVEARPAARSAVGSFFHAIGVLIKAFVLFITGLIAFALIVALIALLIGGLYAYPYSEYIIDGYWVKILLISTLVLLVATPLVAIVVGLIRRLMGNRTKNKYLGWTFTGLWILGFVLFFWVFNLVAREFSKKESIEEEVSLVQPQTGKLVVSAQLDDWRKSNQRFWHLDENNDWNFDMEIMDSIPINNIAVRVAVSKDSSFHAYIIRSSRGRTGKDARLLASHIRFEIGQNDSLISLPRNFKVATKEKFRNQQISFVIEVPVGKRIQFDESINRYDVFDIKVNRKGLSVEMDDDGNNWSDLMRPYPGPEYIMQPNGHLEDMKRLDQEALKKGIYKILPNLEEKDWNENGNDKPNRDGYRYHAPGEKQSSTIDTIVGKNELEQETEMVAEKDNKQGISDGTVNLFSRLLTF